MRDPILLAIGFSLMVTAPQARQMPDNDRMRGVANPASVECGQRGGKSMIQNGSGGAIGYCHFPDGRVCEEWVLLRENVCKSPE
jgi:putative hemolysin